METEQELKKLKSLIALMIDGVVPLDQEIVKRYNELCPPRN